jgi:hypothetical protein
VQFYAIHISSGNLNEAQHQNIKQVIEQYQHHLNIISMLIKLSSRFGENQLVSTRARVKIHLYYIDTIKAPYQNTNILHQLVEPHIPCQPII